MSHLTTGVAASGNNDWINGKISGLIVGTVPNKHYRILFQDAATGKYSWPNIDVALYDIASATYLNDKSVAVQGDISSTGTVKTIMAS